MASHAGTTDFQKCGEVTMAVEFDKKIYALNCIFCGTVCLQLETFAVHIEDHHAEQLYASVLLTTEHEEELAEEKTYIPEFGIKMSNVYKDFDVPKKKTKMRTTNILDEPLLALTVDLSKVEVKQEELFEPEPTNEEVQIEGDVYMEKLEEEEQMIWFNSNNSESVVSDVEPENEEETENDLEDDDLTNDEKGLTLAIIANYEKHRILWDPSEPSAKNRRKCDQAVQQIATAINKKLGLRMKAIVIKQRLRTLRSKFRRELRYRQPCTSKRRRGKYTPLWYYDKLSFLNTSIKYKRHSKRATKTLTDEEPALPLSNLTDKQNRQLIGMYQSSPCLWDVQHMSFRFKNHRQDAMEEMLQDIKIKMSLDFSQDELQKMLNSIRYACTQEKQRKLQCERQEETYVPVCQYYKDISFLEDYVGPFRCVFCEEVINSPDQYLIHKSQHDGSMPFVCPVCNHGFMDSGNYTVHLRRHTRDFPYECEVCGKRYATSTDVKVHMRYHTGDKPYLCQICGQSCRTWTFFDKHMRRHENRPAHKCSICSKTFFENSKLKEHVKAHLNIRDKVCNVCGKAFTSSKYLRQHRLIHAETKKYVCKICGKDFAQYAGLSGHMKSHGTTITGLIAQEEEAE